MKRPYLLALVLLSMTCGTLYAAKAPQWISGDSKAYPSEHYLLGIGVGRDLDGARSSARAEIAKVFKARIAQSSDETSSESLMLAGGRSESSSTQAAALRTVVSTDQELEGVQVVETWYNKKKKQHYALAVLDKRKTRSTLARRAADEEETAQANLGLAVKAASPVEEVRSLTSALEAMDRRDALLERKRVVDPVAVGDPGSSATRAQVQGRLDQALKRIVFVVDAADVAGGNLRDLVNESITRMGFRVLDDASSAESGLMPIGVSGSFVTEPVTRQNPEWKFYRWQGSLEIREGIGEGRVVATISRQGQVSDLTDEAGKTKAALVAAKTLAQEFEGSLKQYIYGKQGW